MYTSIESILSRINSKPSKRLNILTMPTHESYQTLMGNLPHDFYLITHPQLKNWDFHTKPLPKNHYLITKPYPPTFPLGIEFDLVLSQDRFNGFQRLDEIAKQLNLPHIHIAHHLPNYGASPKELAKLKLLKGDATVFVGHASKKEWEGDENSKVIYYGMNCDTFSGWHGSENVGVQVVNHIANRNVFCGWELFQQIASKVPVTLIGENPGLSASAKSTEDLVKNVAKCRYYLNTSLYSNFPMSVAEALCIGIPVVSTKLYEIPYVIKHGENGFLYETPEEAIEYCQLLMKDMEIARKIGEAGRKTALELFDQNRFVTEWNQLIWDTYNKFR